MIIEPRIPVFYHLLPQRVTKLETENAALRSALDTLTRPTADDALDLIFDLACAVEATGVIDEKTKALLSRAEGFGWCSAESDEEDTEEE